MLAIVGGKGGCGKTTTALGLARAFAAAGDRPLVVDADCDMPNLHTKAETDRSPGLAAFADGAPPGLVVHRSRAYPGIEILPAGGASGAIEESTAARLARVGGRVIVDCPAGATDAVAAPLRVADGALVVSTEEPRSLTDAAKTAAMVRALDTPLLGAVLTRVGRDGDQDALVESEPASETARALPDDCPILGLIPEIDGQVLSSRRGRTAYEDLATRIWERNI